MNRVNWKLLIAIIVIGAGGGSIIGGIVRYNESNTQDISSETVVDRK